MSLQKWPTEQIKISVKNVVMMVVIKRKFSCSKPGGFVASRLQIPSKVRDNYSFRYFKWTESFKTPAEDSDFEVCAGFLDKFS
jgi:hypothetical protein